jgi:hypothetical protein
MRSLKIPNRHIEIQGFGRMGSPGQQAHDTKTQTLLLFIILSLLNLIRFSNLF